MSLSKELSQIRRQSYDDRICDDLSEVILQFLSFEDKFRVECVSKQFQRTVFQRVLALHWFGISRLAFESVVKKCPNIKILESHTFLNPSEDDWTKEWTKNMELIVKYWRNLRQIQLSVINHMNDQMFDEFQKKFDLNLLHLLIDAEEDKRNVFKSFGTFSCETRFMCSDVKRIGIKNSRQLNVFHDSEQEFNDFEDMIENNKTLKTFRLIIPYGNPSVWLKHILKLDQLIELDLNDDRNQIVLNNDLIENMRQLAINCKQMKKFHFCVIIDSNDLITQLFSTFNEFKRLKRFELHLVWNENQEIIQQFMNQFFPFKHFKELKDLTHLTFNLYPNVLIDEKIFTDIDINLPNLQELNFGPNIVATEWTADILSRLSRLEDIIIRAEEESVRNTVETKLRANCKKINSFYY